MDPNFRKYKCVLESVVRGGFVASPSPVETVLGQEKGKQPGFAWILALLLLRWTATEQEGHGQAESAFSFYRPSCLFFLMLVRVRHPLSKNAEPIRATVISTALATVSGNHNCLHENHAQSARTSIRGLAKILVWSM